MPNALQYGDLEWEVDNLLERASERLDEKDDEHGGAEWRGDDPRFHVYHAMRNLGDVAEATDGTPDYDEMMKESADALNHLCMALSNVETPDE